MVEMIADVEFGYGADLLKPGAKFDATERDADIMERLKRAHRVSAEASAKDRLDTRDMKAETPKAKPRSKRTYNRRDMKARD